eukprot:GHVQ01008548.1.p1 GENE.GHVQ01008548.1~~GHVQ01008548.1.p1  ORF type:complete len:973 (+),score=190.45 GHVQ01008548.1:356-3274(+)
MAVNRTFLCLLIVLSSIVDDVLSAESNVLSQLFHHTPNIAHLISSNTLYQPSTPSSPRFLSSLSSSSPDNSGSLSSLFSARRQKKSTDKSGGVVLSPVDSSFRVLIGNPSETTGEGVVFFVNPNGTIESCEDRDSVIDHLLKVYTNKHNPQRLTQQDTTRDESKQGGGDSNTVEEDEEVNVSNEQDEREDVADMTITPQEAFVGQTYDKNTTDSSMSDNSNLSPYTSSLAVPQSSSPRRELGTLPHISSYHYMSPQQARTGWTSATYNSYGSPVPVQGGVPLSLIVGGSNAEDNGRGGMRLSGLQQADNIWKKQMAEKKKKEKEEAEERGRQFIPNTVSSLASLIAPLLSPDNPELATLVRNLLSAATAPATPPSPPSSALAVPTLTSRRQLSDLLPPNTPTSSRPSYQSSPPSSLHLLFANNQTGSLEDTATAREAILPLTENPLLGIINSFASVAGAAAPSLIQVAGPVVAEIGKQLLAQAGPIGAEILKTVSLQMMDALRVGNPSLVEAVEEIGKVLLSLLDPLLRTLMEGEMRQQKRMLADTVDRAVGKGLDRGDVEISHLLNRILTQELPATLENVMTHSIDKMIQESLVRHGGGGGVQEGFEDRMTDTVRDSVREGVMNMLGGTDIQRAVGDAVKDGLNEYVLTSKTKKGLRELQSITAQSLQPTNKPYDNSASRDIIVKAFDRLSMNQQKDKPSQQQPVTTSQPIRIHSLPSPPSPKVAINKQEKARSRWDHLMSMYRGTADNALDRFKRVQQEQIKTAPSRIYTAPAHITKYQQAMLDGHNQFRTRGGVQAVQWDSDLERFIIDYMQSQDKYKQCKFEHSKQPKRKKVGTFTNIGENLYTSWGTTKFPTAERIVEAWYNELYCYRYGPVGSSCTKRPGGQCATIGGFSGPKPLTGHFTQLMWHSVTHIGCATIQCRSYNGKGSKFFGGCSYGSLTAGYGGNMVGEVPFDSKTALQMGLSGGRCA